MKLIVLGSGTSVPQAYRCSPGFWLETDQGSLLLDMGADVPHRLALEELDWPNLDAIWISHFHLDHLGGLAPFLFGCRWAPEMHDRRKPLKIFGPLGLASLIQTVSDVDDYKLLQQTFPVEIIEMRTGNDFEILPNLVASTLSTPHTSESLAVRLTEQNGKSLVYSSDTGFSTELIAFAKEVTVLLLECSFRSNKPLRTHLELSDVVQIIRGCEPGTAMLIHLYPEWNVGSVAAEARALWSGNVIEATDGLRLEF